MNSYASHSIPGTRLIIDSLSSALHSKVCFMSFISARNSVLLRLLAPFVSFPRERTLDFAHVPSPNGVVLLLLRLFLLLRIPPTALHPLCSTAPSLDIAAATIARASRCVLQLQVFASQAHDFFVGGPNTGLEHVHDIWEGVPVGGNRMRQLDRGSGTFVVYLPDFHGSSRRVLRRSNGEIQVDVFIFCENIHDHDACELEQFFF